MSCSRSKSRAGVVQDSRLAVWCSSPSLPGPWVHQMGARMVLRLGEGVPGRGLLQHRSDLGTPQGNRPAWASAGSAFRQSDLAQGSHCQVGCVGLQRAQMGFTETSWRR